MKLTTIAHTDGMHAGKPRIDKKLLGEYGEGIIATSSCLGGEIPQMFLAHRTEEAYAAARWYRDVLGPKNFFLEIQEHGGSAEQKIVNEALYQMHRDLEIPLIATNDLHYVAEGDAHAHDILLCVQTRSQITDAKRFKFDCSEYFLRSPQQMHTLFPELGDALLNTVRLAERCVVNPYARKASLPTVPIPEGFENDEVYFRHLCYEGVRRLYGDISETVR
jgi:DNA polymerase-3 subunit alpha